MHGEYSKSGEYVLIIPSCGIQAHGVPTVQREGGNIPMPGITTTRGPAPGVPGSIMPPHSWLYTQTLTPIALPALIARQGGCRIRRV